VFIGNTNGNDVKYHIGGITFGVVNNSNFEVEYQSGTGTAFQIVGGDGGIYMPQLPNVAGDEYLHINTTTNEVVRSSGTPSDRRWKEDIKKTERGIEEVLKMKVFDYLFKGREMRETGLIAQDIEEILPEAIWRDKDGYMSIRYERVIPLLVKAIQDLSNEIKVLKRDD
jgi:hypothetical protein